SPTTPHPSPTRRSSDLCLCIDKACHTRAHFWCFNCWGTTKLLRFFCLATRNHWGHPRKALDYKAILAPLSNGARLPQSAPVLKRSEEHTSELQSRENLV